MKRIQRSRKKGWRLPRGARCCTRPGIFGNPFGSAEAFRAWVERGEIYLSDLVDGKWFPWTPESSARLRERRERLLRELPSLRGLDLACFCSLDAECHVDVLLELANS